MFGRSVTLGGDITEGGDGEGTFSAGRSEEKDSGDAAGVANGGSESSCGVDFWRDVGVQ